MKLNVFQNDIIGKFNKKIRDKLKSFNPDFGLLNDKTMTLQYVQSQLKEHNVGHFELLPHLEIVTLICLHENDPVVNIYSL